MTMLNDLYSYGVRIYDEVALNLRVTTTLLWFMTDDLNPSDVATRALNSEILSEDGRANMTDRQVVARYPSVPFVGVAPNPRVQSNRTISNIGNQLVGNTPITVSDAGVTEAPIAINLFAPFLLIASDEECRRKFMAHFCEGCKVPAFAGLLFKCIRTGTVFNICYKFAIHKDWIIYVNKHNLSNTYIDPEYMRTDAGMTDFLSFCNTLSNCTTCKDWFVSYTAGFVPSFDSGSTLTATVLNIVSGDAPYSDKIVRLWTGHAYGSNVNSLHVMLSAVGLFRGYSFSLPNSVIYSSRLSPGLESPGFVIPYNDGAMYGWVFMLVKYNGASKQDNPTKDNDNGKGGKGKPPWKNKSKVQPKANNQQGANPPTGNQKPVKESDLLQMIGHIIEAFSSISGKKYRIVLNA